MCATCQLSASLPLVWRDADATSCQSLIWRNLLNALLLPLPLSLPLSLPLQLLPTDDKLLTDRQRQRRQSRRSLTVRSCLAGQ